MFEAQAPLVIFNRPRHGVLKQSVLDQEDANHCSRPSFSAFAVDGDHVVRVSSEPVVDLGEANSVVNPIKHLALLNYDSSVLI